MQNNDPRRHFASCPEKQRTKKLPETKICKIVIHNGNIQTSQELGYRSGLESLVEKWIMFFLFFASFISFASVVLFLPSLSYLFSFCLLIYQMKVLKVIMWHWFVCIYRGNNFDLWKMRKNLKLIFGSWNRHIWSVFGVNFDN